MIDTLLHKMKMGDRVALSKIITIIENDENKRREIIKKIFVCPADSKIICFTGPPGVGKSTLISHVLSILTESGKKVGVILVDPRSPYTGGSLLGDRIRMQRHTTDPNVFIRSISCADNPEGVSRSVKDIIKVMSVAGMDYILVETVGTGQIAVEVSYICHTTVLVLMPNMGDDIQMMKAGIIETADIFVINKSDIEGADLTYAYLKDNVENRNGWKPPIIKTVGYNKATVLPLVEKIEEHLKRKHCRYEKKVKALLTTMFLDEMDEIALQFLNNNKDFDKLVEDVISCRKDYYTATEELLEKLKKEVFSDG